MVDLCNSLHYTLVFQDRFSWMTCARVELLFRLQSTNHNIDMETTSSHRFEQLPCLWQIPIRLPSYGIEPEPLATQNHSFTIWRCVQRAGDNRTDPSMWQLLKPFEWPSSFALNQKFNFTFLTCSVFTVSHFIRLHAWAHSVLTAFLTMWITIPSHSVRIFRFTKLWFYGFNSMWQRKLIYYESHPAIIGFFIYLSYNDISLGRKFPNQRSSHTVFNILVVHSGKKREERDWVRPKHTPGILRVVYPRHCRPLFPHLRSFSFFFFFFLHTPYEKELTNNPKSVGKL